MSSDDNGAMPEEFEELQRKPSLKNVNSYTLSMLSKKASQKLLSKEEPESILSPKSRGRQTIVPTMDKFNFQMSLSGSNSTSLAWNEYQELKLILFSVNFRGKESIKFTDLKKQFARLETNNFKMKQLSSLFSIFKDEVDEIYRIDLEAFIDELEHSMKSRGLQRESIKLNLSEVEALLAQSSDVPLLDFSDLIKMLQDILTASNGKIVEMLSENASAVVKQQLAETLMKLNQEASLKIELIKQEMEQPAETIRDLLGQVSELGALCDQYEGEVLRLREQTFHLNEEVQATLNE